MSNFAAWFKRITGREPFPYQKRLAARANPPNFIEVPTGGGKTAAVVLGGWLWDWVPENANKRPNTPRRLVYCLPMRTLVDQTFRVVKAWVKTAGLSEQIGVHCLMGGAVDKTWEDTPEKPCILIGTQDQLLSRALNRGYSMSRYKWPIHFALLNNDCLWVMDEVQLMGIGLRTTAQLQAFREFWGTYGPAHSIWMSATLDPTPLETVDYKPDTTQCEQLDSADAQSFELQKRREAKKPLARAISVFQGKEKDYAKAIAAEIIGAHVPGSLTLVICNRVSRAQAIYAALEKVLQGSSILVHSRFRPSDRKDKNEQLQDKDLDGIVVATQTIEAGVDISARVMFTELAPWSSMVQRFGRCNRTGDETSAAVYWIDFPELDNARKAKEAAAPYEPELLVEAKEHLSRLEDVGLITLQEIKLQSREIEGLIPRQHDLLQLFDTTTDLAGHDIDVSPFIREVENTNVAIAWRAWDGAAPPAELGQLQQDELCQVSYRQAKAFLEQLGKNKKQRYGGWVWDGIGQTWRLSETLYPGMTLLLHSRDGGYSTELGFTGDPKHKPVPPVFLSQTIAHDSDSSDHLAHNANRFVSLKEHAQDVTEEAIALCQALPYQEDLPVGQISRAARYHDSGKAHPTFQSALTYKRPERVGQEFWAKSDHDYKNPADRYKYPDDRRGFRHELVSALLAMAEGEDFLLCYLVACHHGKVRMSIQPRPTEKLYMSEQPNQLRALGVQDGDEVPEVEGAEIDLGDDLVISRHKLSLACMELGLSQDQPSWSEQAIALLESSEYGPFRLALLETLIRIADWRGTRRHTSDAVEAPVW